MSTTTRTNEAGELVITSTVALPPHLAKLCETEEGRRRVESAIRSDLAAELGQRLRDDADRQLRELMQGTGTETPRGVLGS